MSETTAAQRLSGKILDVTQRMSILAQSASWDELLSLATERQQLLEDLFSPVSSASTEQIAALQKMIVQVLATDRSLLAMASVVRDETLSDLDSHLFKQKAVSAYQAQS